MSGAIEATDYNGINVTSLIEAAEDVGSLVTDFGDEFMTSSPNVSEFEVPSFDVSSLGGFGEVGSFAGSASWFDTFNPGSILDSIPSVSDFNISSLSGSLPSLSSIKNLGSTISTGFDSLTSSLPSLSSIKNIAGTVTSAAGGAAQSVSSVINKIAPSVGAASSALGIQNPLSTITKATQQVAGIAGAAAGISGSAPSSGIGNFSTNSLVSSGAAALGINPATASSLTARATSLFATDPTASTARNAATGATINTPREVDQFGLNILSDAETNALNRLRDPALVNSFTDPGVTREVIDQVTGEIKEVAAPVNLSNQASQYTSTYNPETGKWDVFDNLTSTTVRSGLSESEAIVAEQDLNITSGIALSTDTTSQEDPFEQARLAAEGRSSQQPTIRPEELATSPYVIATTTPNTVVGTPGTLTNINVTNLVQQARQQQTLRNLTQTKAQRTDWRVKLRLAPNSTYLYNDPNGAGILDPLSAKNGTDGVIFPYTPAIETAYKANYTTYDLTHSNFRGYFYQGSYVDAINLRCTFTAQDTNEANYLLAVIHFFRSVTKMFYGKDTERGSPPPLVFLSGLGDYQFNEHPCVVSQFNYSLPPDVDYIRARSTLDISTNLLNNRTRTSIPGNPLSYGINRLLSSGLFQGATPNPATVGNLPAESPTYVPTKMEIALTLFPIQSRQQASTQFSLKGFANGNLLRGGFW